MNRSYYFSTGLAGKNAMQIRLEYNKDAGGYVAAFQMGDRSGNGLFGWHIDADYFRFYQRHQLRVIVPCARRNTAKEQAAAAYLEKNALDYAREFAAACERDGAPRMTITAA